MTKKNDHYEMFGEEEVKMFEKLGEVHKKKDSSDKTKVKHYIRQKNLEEMQKRAQGELEEEEYIEAEFEGTLTSLNYWANLTSAEYAFVRFAAYRDIPTKYHVFLTTEQVIIYEVKPLNEIGRQYVFKYSAITHFKFKKYKTFIKLFFKVEEDKYDELRMSGSWFLYPFVHRRIGINIASADREILLKFIQKKLSSI